MEIATFVLAIVGAVTGVGSLGWQVVTFNRSGPVVHVTATQAFPTYGNQVGDPHVDVTARNTGRSPVTVQSWGIELPDGQVMVSIQQLPWSASLPHRLEPGASASWYIETKAVQDECAKRGFRHQDVRAYVNLGTGQVIRAEGKWRGIGMQ